jgi:Na+-driven multidrug efflux pump
VLIALGGVISQIFAQEQAVIDIIKLFIFTLPLGYGLQGIIILTNSSLNALHKPMHALVLSVVRLFVFYLPFAYLGSLFADIKGLFIGALIGNVCTAIVSYHWFKGQLSKCHGKHNVEVC